jgi:selenide,water dikinase
LHQLLIDPQSCGPLLAAIPNELAVLAVSELQQAGFEQATVVGRARSENKVVSATP